MNKPINSKAYFLILTILSSAQIFVLLIFSGVVYWLVSTGQMIASDELSPIFQYVVPIALISGLTGAHLIFKTMIKNIRAEKDLKTRLQQYQRAFIIRTAFLEFPGLLAGVAALLTGQLYFLAGCLLAVVMMILLRPTAFSLSEDLNLTSEERSLISNPDSSIS